MGKTKAEIRGSDGKDSHLHNMHVFNHKKTYSKMAVCLQRWLYEGKCNTILGLLGTGTDAGFK